jgi:RNA polymerase sigma factor (sigma-70 family)
LHGSGLDAARGEQVNSYLGPLLGPMPPDEPQPSAAAARGSDPAEPPAVDDAATIEASWSDPERFAALFDRHAALIHRYIARRAGPEIADDLVAETFLAAFRHRQRYDLLCRDARPWLYGIATNLVGQHRRDEFRQLRILMVTKPDLDPPGHADQVAANVTASGTKAVLARVLADLPAAERDVLLLIAWEQLSYAETAAALQIPVGTVRSRLSRARARLREVLAGSEASATFKEILRK